MLLLLSDRINCQLNVKKNIRVGRDLLLINSSEVEGCHKFERQITSTKRE